MKFFANFSQILGFHLEKKSTILLVFFPYLAQIIISITGCVACNDLWPWPIFLRSFSLDLENRVRSVASTVLDGFFPYLVQMITSMRRCVTCDDLWPRPISSRSFDLDTENRVRGGGYPRLWYRLIYLVVHALPLVLHKNAVAIRLRWSSKYLISCGHARGLFNEHISKSASSLEHV